MRHSMLPHGLVVLLLASACTGGPDTAADKGTPTDDTGTPTDDTGTPSDDCNEDDVDADGHTTCDGDCDDLDPEIYPGAEDAFLQDRDCDGHTEASLGLAHYALKGESLGDAAGVSVASAGDVDGDGLDDILVGAHYTNDGGTAAGSAYVVLGKSLGASGTFELAAADHTLVGEEAEDYAGLRVASAGDVDGDGLDDILVAAYANDTGGNNAGSVYVILGASLAGVSTLDLSAADHRLVGEAAQDYAGTSIASAGDVDGDGLDDILVGMSGGGGGAYLIYGKSLGGAQTINLSSADVRIGGEHSYDQAGVSLASAGDVDGDGLADILVGAHYGSEAGSSSGSAYLIYGKSLAGSSTFNLSDADHQFVGAGEYNFAGSSVAGAGDVDGDGFDDILVGAYGNSDGGLYAGSAYVILAASLGSSPSMSLSQADHQLVGVMISDMAGFSVAGAGDVDGDGLDDVLVGAMGNDDGAKDAGSTYIVLGASMATVGNIDLSQADHQLMGEHEGDYSALGVAGAGDVNGDGHGDILVGAYDHRSGRAYVVLGGS